MITIDVYRVVPGVWIAVTKNDYGDATTALGFGYWHAQNRLVRKVK